MLNCPLRKIKKKAGEINRLIEDEVNKLGGTENVEYTVMFYNEFGMFDLGKTPLDADGDLMIDLNNILMCNEREMGDGRGEITIIWFSNKVQDDIDKLLNISGEER